MKNTTRTVRAGLAVVLLSTAALALSAKDGYVAAPVFSLSDIQSSIGYDAGSAGVEWDDMDAFALGPLARTSGVGEEAALAEGANGEIFALVYGYIGVDYYTGVISFDGSGAAHIAQDAQLDASVPWHYRAGGNMRAIAVAPVTDGLLTAGHVLVVRTWRDQAKFVPGGDSGDTYLEIIDIDPGTGGRTLVHRWLSTINATARLAVDSDGGIYVLQTGVLDTAGSPTGPDIRKLTWNGSDYDDSVLVGDVEGGVLVGPDGYVYTFADHQGLGWSYSDGTKPEILRVDPDTGVTSSYALVDGRSFINDWAFDSEGNLRIALDGGRKQAISTVPAGGTATAGRGAIASWTGDFVNLAPGSEGRLYVAEAIFGSDADVYTLDPDSGGGGGGGGGGGHGGGGKGKNK